MTGARTPEQSNDQMNDEELIQRLRDIPGFVEGYDRRSRIVRLGTLLRKLRNDWVQLNQTEAAKLLGMEQSELSRIETGLGERGPSYSTLAGMIDRYSAYLRSKGATVTLSIDIQNRNRHDVYALTTDLTDALQEIVR